MRVPPVSRIFPLIAGLLLLTAVTPLPAQDGGGQFCLRSFEDRNGNGTLDPGEPPLTAGVSADLRDGDGLVVASGQLDDSPLAAQGVVCFQFLQSGEYTLLVSDSMRQAGGGVIFTRRIEDGGAPTLIDYAAPQQALATAAAPTRGAGNLSQLLPRVGLSLLGALLVVVAMLALGALIWFFALRRPAPSRRR
ncbi:MAG: hypothetical protein OXP68_04360 [Anaerolineaceae bacterium]|nr:hypothetical protein [Anaerolineaceae bacterium]MDE0327833.1 hypothetical protein [Anaerolineaceae bacterium]